MCTNLLNTIGGDSVKDQFKYFLLGFVLIFFSSPLGLTTLNIIYINRNLTSEFTVLLNGFINSYVVIGIMLCLLGLVKMLIKNKS